MASALFALPPGAELVPGMSVVRDFEQVGDLQFLERPNHSFRIEPFVQTDCDFRDARLPKPLNELRQLVLHAVGGPGRSRPPAEADQVPGLPGEGPQRMVARPDRFLEVVGGLGSGLSCLSHLPKLGSLAGSTVVEARSEIGLVDLDLPVEQTEGSLLEGPGPSSRRQSSRV